MDGNRLLKVIQLIVKLGVRRYNILRPIDDPNYVIIDLEFESLKEAEDILEALHNLWSKVEGQVMMNPKTQILDLEETTNV